jgi:hypothetical protein
MFEDWEVRNVVKVSEVNSPGIRLFTAGNHGLGQSVSVISGSLSPQHGVSSGCGWRNGLQIWRVAANIRNKQSRTADKGWSSSLEVGRGTNNSSP